MGSYVSRSLVLAIAACLLASAAPAGADAVPLPADPAARTAGWSTAGAAPAGHANTSLPNGDFEAGSFAGWSTVDTGDGAWYVYTGTPAFPAPPPPQGNFAAVTDQTGPGTHLLMRDIAVPSAGNATLSFILYYTNNAGTFWTPETLDHNSSGPNQQYRVDLMTTTSPVDSVAPGDIVTMLYRTEVGAPASLAPTTLAYDLSAYAGQTLRLRFAEVDNQGNFWASVDDVRFGNATPPPPGAPDLVVLDVALDPAAPEPGQGVVFTATLRNVGNGTAGPSTVFFQIDSPDGPSTFVGAPSLAPGQTVSVSTSPSPGMEQGNHTITALADVDNTVAEADETNNAFVRSFHVGPIGPAADLAVSSDDIRITKRMLRTDYTDPLVNPLAGADIDVTVRNVGPEAAFQSSLLIEACGSPPAFPSVRPPCEFVDLVPLPPLAPGDSVDVSAFWDTRTSLGDVEIVASIQYVLPQESYENDVARKATFVVVGGTGLGGISV